MAGIHAGRVLIAVEWNANKRNDDAQSLIEGSSHTRSWSVFISSCLQGKDQFRVDLQVESN